MDARRNISEVIAALRRVRVRQGESHAALAIIAGHLESLIDSDDRMSRAAADIRNQALELGRVRPLSVPPFVVEDLLDEAIANLQQASILSSGLRASAKRPADD